MAGVGSDLRTNPAQRSAERPRGRGTDLEPRPATFARSSATDAAVGRRLIRLIAMRDCEAPQVHKVAVSALPEIARGVLPTGFHIHDGAAAVVNQGGKPGPAIASGAAVGG
jgi:hypothetical protein